MHCDQRLLVPIQCIIRERQRHGSLSHLDRLNAQPVPISVEENVSSQPFSSIARFNPLTPPSARPQAFQEAYSAVLGIRPVMGAQNRLYSFCRLIGMIEWDHRNVVMEDMSFDNAVEQRTTYEAEFSIDGRCGSGSKSPGLGPIMRNGRVCVL